MLFVYTYGGHKVPNASDVTVQIHLVRIVAMEKSRKKALVLQGGTIKGAFLVGALLTFYEKLGKDYFDLIIATSVGVFEQAFFASGQIRTMENTWREYVSGIQLINPLNPFRGRAILDLDYLVEIFQNDKSILDVEAMKGSHPQLLTFVTDCKTREPKLLDLKKDVFNINESNLCLALSLPQRGLCRWE